METQTTLEAVNVTITVYYPLPEELVIDMNHYYPDLCCFEIIAVESRDNSKSESVLIALHKTSIIYKADDSEVWEDVDAYDIIQYVIKDINTGQTAIGEITIQRIENPEFVLEDLTTYVDDTYIFY